MRPSGRGAKRLEGRAIRCRAVHVRPIPRHPAFVRQRASGRALVLEGLTLALTEARIGILGRNGSGKSTLLRLIAGLIAPDAGTVRVEGFDPSQPPCRTAGHSILFQNPDHQILFPTVEEELAFGLLQQGATKDEAAGRVSTLLAAEGRAHWAKAPVTTLSQGQRHYLCLLSVLLMEPGRSFWTSRWPGWTCPLRHAWRGALRACRNGW